MERLNYREDVEGKVLWGFSTAIVPWRMQLWENMGRALWRFCRPHSELRLIMIMGVTLMQSDELLSCKGHFYIYFWAYSVRRLDSGVGLVIYTRK